MLTSIGNKWIFLISNKEKRETGYVFLYFIHMYLLGISFSSTALSCLQIQRPSQSHYFRCVYKIHQGKIIFALFCNILEEQLFVK